MDEPMICGGHSSVQHDSNGEVQALLNRVRAQAQQHAQASGWNGVFTELACVSYRVQVVAGLNYTIKARIRPGKFAHLKVYCPLGDQEPQVTEIHMDKKETDEL